MNTLTIDGWSDDLIHVRGDDFAEEYTAGSDDAGWLRVRLRRCCRGGMPMTKEVADLRHPPGPRVDDRAYYRAPIVGPMTATTRTAPPSSCSQPNSKRCVTPSSFRCRSSSASSVSTCSGER